MGYLTPMQTQEEHFECLSRGIFLTKRLAAPSPGPYGIAKMAALIALPIILSLSQVHLLIVLGCWAAVYTYGLAVPDREGAVAEHRKIIFGVGDYMDRLVRRRLKCLAEKHNQKQSLLDCSVEQDAERERVRTLRLRLHPHLIADYPELGSIKTYANWYLMKDQKLIDLMLEAKEGRKKNLSYLTDVRVLIYRMMDEKREAS